MNFDDPAIRAAFRLGASECYQSVATKLQPPLEREVLQWLSDLYLWRGGAPPVAPHGWTETDVSEVRPKP